MQKKRISMQKKRICKTKKHIQCGGNEYQMLKNAYKMQKNNAYKMQAFPSPPPFAPFCPLIPPAASHTF